MLFLLERKQVNTLQNNLIPIKVHDELFNDLTYENVAQIAERL